MSEKKNLPIQAVSKGKRFEWKLCSSPLCPVPFDVSTRLKDVGVELLLWLLVGLHVSLEQFFPLLSCLICAADTCTARTYTHNTVTHSVSQPCGPAPTHSRTFFPNTAGFTNPPPTGRTGTDQKEGEKTLSHNYKGRKAFSCTLS